MYGQATADDEEIPMIYQSSASTADSDSGIFSTKNSSTSQNSDIFLVDDKTSSASKSQGTTRVLITEMEGNCLKITTGALWIELDVQI